MGKWSTMQELLLGTEDETVFKQSYAFSFLLPSYFHKGSLFWIASRIDSENSEKGVCWKFQRDMNGQIYWQTSNSLNELFIPCPWDQHDCWLLRVAGNCHSLEGAALQSKLFLEYWGREGPFMCFYTHTTVRHIWAQQLGGGGTRGVAVLNPELEGGPCLAIRTKLGHPWPYPFQGRQVTNAAPRAAFLSLTPEEEGRKLSHSPCQSGRH